MKKNVSPFIKSFNPIFKKNFQLAYRTFTLKFKLNIRTKLFKKKNLNLIQRVINQTFFVIGNLFIEYFVYIK